MGSSSTKGNQTSYIDVDIAYVYIYAKQHREMKQHIYTTRWSIAYIPGGSIITITSNITRGSSITGETKARAKHHICESNREAR